MKKFLLLIVFCVVACISKAQITTNEMPYGLLIKSNRTFSPNAAVFQVQHEVKTISNTYRMQIAQEDLINDAIPGPLRYAFAVPANYTLKNSGTWQTLSDGSKLWRLKVSLPDALSTNTYYNKFWLPDGAKFFVYSEDTKQSIGAIRSEYITGNKDNPAKFATAIIYGENIVYEYCQPASVVDTADISISRIDYGYRYIDNPYAVQLRNFGDAGNCQVNINCQEGNNWQMEKHAVARVGIVSPNGFWCSCALVNNTARAILAKISTFGYKYCVFITSLHQLLSNYCMLFISCY
jgi:hypothetical protein